MKYSSDMDQRSAYLASWAYGLWDFVKFLLASAGHVAVALYLWVTGRPLRDLKGEVALITGGGGGLGRLLAMRLARLQCTVVLWDINKEGLDETNKLVISLGGRCHSYIVDLANRDEVYKAAVKVTKDCGAVTLLINNAGLVSGKTFLETPDHMIQKTFDVNILAHFWTTKAFLPEMVRSNNGHIVTIASLAGHIGVPKLVDYCSSKFAAVGFDEALRAELEAMKVMGVKTTAICPFFIRSTGMFEDVHSRFLMPLNLNEVADRIILAIRGNEKFAIIPGYLQLLLPLKWIFPWGCISGLMRCLVPDAAPGHGNAVTHTNTATETVMQGASEKLKTESSMPFQRTAVIEREP